MKVYHGSEFIIKVPEYGKGKIHNDYGQGFYCTENTELAKEWSCDENHDGFSNGYTLDLNGLNVLNINSEKYTILHWLTILIQNRTFRLTNPIAKDAKEYLIQHFSIDLSDYDVVIGYRADDSYFAFAEDFLNNTISVSKLSKAMRLGNLGEQVVLISENAFSHLTFIDAEPALKNKYFALKMKRDKKARTEYLKRDRKPSYDPDELYVLDLMRQNVKENDPRLRP